MMVEEAFDATEEVETGVATVDAVIAIGIGLEFELNASLNELFCKFGGVLEVNIVVS